MHEEKEKFLNQADQQFSELKRENEELHKLVSEKTAGLEKLNQELVIEACLERVRTVAMSMRKPEDMLEVCRMISDQLEFLGVKSIRNVQTVIINEPEQQYINYQYFAPYSKDSIEFIDYRLHPDVLDFTEKMLSSEDAYYTKIFTGEELQVWRDYRKQTNQLPDPKLDKAQSAYYYFYSIGSGALGLTTYAPVGDETLLNFKRFRNVFDLAYRRYRDIAKAEEQAREAQIEVALERVRARAMAMQKSDELLDAAELLYRELSRLGIQSLTCGYVFMDQDKNTGWNYSVNPEDGTILKQPIGLLHDGSEILRSRKESWKNQEPFHEAELDTAATIEHQKYIAETSINYPITSARLLSISPERLVLNSFNFSQGYLLVVGEGKLSNEQREMVVRFAKVFELTYTRFLDLEQAEAQAREAQIELSLERVRARAMAMQNSDELADLVSIVFMELTRLDFPVTSCIIWINNQELSTEELWVANAEMNKPPRAYFINPFHHSFFRSIIHAWKERDRKWIYELSGKEKEDFQSEFFKDVSILPDVLKRTLREPEKVVFSASFSSFGALEIVGTEPIPDEKFDILHRFGKVFDLSYSRFNDIRKAEAQAREANIELGLERVRTRAMAMQNSDDINEMIGILFSEMTKLDMVLTRCVIMIFEPSTLGSRWYMANAEDPFHPNSYYVKYHENPPYLAFIQAWKERKNKLQYSLEGKEKVEWDNVLFHETELSKLPDFVIAGMRAPEKILLSASFNNFGCLNVASLEPLSDEHSDILLRFAKVFDLTYTRFNDIKKAESQAREARIETALERVRSRTMAMQHSEELTEAANLLFLQVQALGVPAWSCGFNIMDNEGESCTGWMSTEGELQPPFRIPLTESPVFIRFHESRKNGIDFYAEEISGDELVAHYRYMKSLPVFGEILDRHLRSGFILPAFQINHVVNFSHGNLIFITGDPVPEAHDIFKRFAKVFEQTYTRFLDLKKAEAQAREAQIELALERVRARTMAMFKSDELADAAAVLFQQLHELGDTPERINIGIVNEEAGIIEWWLTEQNGRMIDRRFSMSIDEPIFMAKMYAAWKKKLKSVVLDISGKELTSWLEYISTVVGIPFRQEYLHERRVNSVAFFSQGMIAFTTAELQSTETIQLLERFAKVFDLTYTRFLDLKKAEAQARESKIETALERVRARTMAMQKSDELADVAKLLFRQVKELGIEAWTTGFNVWSEDNNSFTDYVTNPEGDLMEPYTIDTNQAELFREVRDARKSGMEFFVHDVEGEKLKEAYLALNRFGDKKQFEKILRDGYRFPSHQFDHFVFGSKVSLLFITYDQVPEAHDLFKRFGKVFEQTYTRFLDLKKAEAQARESQIEAGLERVRSRTLAMHKSDELAETAAVLFRQLINLGIAPNRLYIFILQENSNLIEAWITDEDGSRVNNQFRSDASRNASLRKMVDGWKAKMKSLTVDMQGQELQDYFHYLADELKVPFKGGLSQTRRVQNVAYFNQGLIGIASPDPQPEETVQLLERFAAVFNLTYTRFNDLKIAEAQTHKANIEVALERVRARALAMQQPEELVEVANVMRHEMGLLGVEELETSSIYINSENPGEAECWYSLKDAREEGKEKVSDHFSLHYRDTWVGRQMLDFHQSAEKETSIIMTGEHRKEWISYCAQQSPLLQGYYGEVIPDRTYHLCKFSNGAIGAATPGEISMESRELLSRAASVFSLAYSRFKDLTQARSDLQKLKEEKQRAEQALAELKATQTQLIQAEKMASLGEMTAGIAHEIQNPLNFVNNFSEVNAELSDEILEAAGKGNIVEVLQLAADIKSNQEKIREHGKRADAIVKGMLQHSRSSSGEKQPTDINALADEYLRLAYHGIRAKDSSFNARLETALDKNIEMISIVPQDIGRVILNLISNAFYAVAEKQKSGIKGFEPVVSVETSRLDDMIRLVVKDNGTGIPKKALDKVFQPFFTTKPTGQGTGLGLSLSYDIIKSHGGDLKVETMEGEGSNFIIELPYN